MEANDIMGVEDVADWLDVHQETVRRLVSKGEIPGKKVGGVWRFSRSELTKWWDAKDE